MTSNHVFKVMSGWIEVLRDQIDDHRTKAFGEELKNITRDGRVDRLSTEFKRTADDIKWRLAKLEGAGPTTDWPSRPMNQQERVAGIAEQAYSQVYLLASRVERLEKQVAHLSNSDKMNDTILETMAEEIKDLKEAVNGKSKKR